MAAPTKILTHYDFVIFGEHPAALWGAVLALEAGFKVLVLPFGGGTAKNLIPKFAAAKLEIDPPRDSDPIQILTHDRRFRLGDTVEEWTTEHEFCFNQPIDPVMGPRADILRGFAYLYRGDETGPSVSQPWGEVASRVSNTVFLTESDQDLRKGCFELIRKKGGTVLAPESLAQIFVERKKFVGVKLKSQSQVITAEQGIFSAPLPFLQPLLNVDGHAEVVKMRSHPLGWHFDITISISPDAIPPGLTSRMIYVQKDAPIVDILHLAHEGEPGRFRLRVTLPFEERSLNRAEQRRISQRLVRLMSELIPDFQYNVREVVPEIRDPERTETEELPKLYPFEKLADIPLPLLVYGVPGIGWKTPIQGLGMASDETDPGLGEWGAYRSIQSIFQAWFKRAEKLEQPKRQPLLDSVARSVNI